MPDLIRLIVAIVACQSAGLLGALATQTGSSSWYQQLHKPPFNPPGWVFGPVWTALYLMMAVAAWLVWRQGLSIRPVRVALVLFAAQLALNVAWTPVFFGMRSIVGGLVVIVLLLAAIVATTAAFWPLSRPAAGLMLPYLGWVCFATVLNASFLVLNR